MPTSLEKQDKQRNLEVLQKSLHYFFKNQALLTQALTHRSAQGEDNERLEFLGDALLNNIIAQVLYHEHPKAAEGELSRYRAYLVKEETLASIAKQFHLGDYLRLGTGELKSGGYRRASILADALEALIGAIYLDSDFEKCQKIILQWFQSGIESVADLAKVKDAKTMLQELLQSQKKPIPTYFVTNTEGEQHEKIFYVLCEIKEPPIKTQGKGATKRFAEQMAAKLMLEKLSIFTL